MESLLFAIENEFEENSSNSIESSLSSDDQSSIVELIREELPHKSTTLQENCADFISKGWSFISSNIESLFEYKFATFKSSRRQLSELEIFFFIFDDDFLNLLLVSNNIKYKYLLLFFFNRKLLIERQQFKKINLLKLQKIYFYNFMEHTF